MFYRRGTTFEELPNDIIYDLFEYFTVDELNHSFFSLNRRYDSLLSQCQHLQLVLCNPDDIQYRVRKDFILEHVSKLVVEHSKTFHQTIDPKLLANIRCLVLAKPTRQQWDFIDGSLFPNLQRLHLMDSVFTYRTEKICQNVFSSTFSYLYSCSLSHVPFEETNLWQTSLSLRVLEVNVMDTRVYGRILTSCPNLLKLKIRLRENYDVKSMPALTSIHEHRHLRILCLVPMNPINCDFIDYFLRFVPNLESFALRTMDSRPSYVPMTTLNDLLDHRTPRLKRIQLRLSIADELRRNERLMKTDHRLLREREVRFNLHQPWSLIISSSCWKEIPDDGFKFLRHARVFELRWHVVSMFAQFEMSASLCLSSSNKIGIKLSSVLRVCVLRRSVHLQGEKKLFAD